MAKKSYIPDLRTSIDDEIASLAAQRAESQSIPGAAPQSAVPGRPVPPQAPPIAAPGAVRSPAPGQVDEPYPAAPLYGEAPAQQPSYAPPLPAAAAPKRSRRIATPLLGLLAAVVILGGLGLLVALLSFHGRTTSPSTLPTATPGVQPTATPVTPPSPTTPAFSGAAFALLLAVVVIVLLISAMLLIVSNRRGGERQVAGATGNGMASTTAIESDLNLQIQRLQQLRAWVNEDPTFSRLVDNIIGKQVKSSERRQQVFSILLGVISLVAGWLLSAFTPPITHLLGH